jgi:glucose-1-phosphate cytidylyltransferase
LNQRSKLKVMILCGGLGTRLREETEFRPKPMVEIGGLPMLWHIMKIFSHSGYREFVLCLGYRGSMIKEYFLNYEAMNNDFTIHLGRRNEIDYHGSHTEQDFRITMVDTGLETMTGGRIKRASRYIDDDLCIVTYGDGVGDIDIDKLVEFHRSHGRLATITVVRPRSRFGVLDLSDDGQVERFTEKPVEKGWVNVGFFVFNRRVFDLLDSDQCILEREPLERLARDKELIAYRHTGSFFIMDTYREYQALNEIWKSGEAPWKVWKE